MVRIVSDRSPMVSVVMPVYNGERYLREAIGSILRQTFTDFEFIIINDGSTDGTAAIINSYTDRRIRLINQTNRGLVYSLNRGIEEARGKYIARMDADDVSAATRLSTELELFKSKPNAAIVGTSVIRIDESGRQLGADYYLAHDNEIRQDMALRCPFAHGSVIVRKDLVRQAGGYRQEFWPAEDYDLWRRVAPLGELVNSLEPLYFHRQNGAGISILNRSSQSEIEKRISNEILERGGLNTNLPLRTCLDSYRESSKQARDQATARIIENHYKILLECARRGKVLRASYRFVRLAISGYPGLAFAATKIARLLHLTAQSKGRHERA
jgi:glycosyltransferase involved in cell wall biosynthesis